MQNRDLPKEHYSQIRKGTTCEAAAQLQNSIGKTGKQRAMNERTVKVGMGALNLTGQPAQSPRDTPTNRLSVPHKQ